MANYFYAQLNSDNIVVGKSKLPEKNNFPHMIEIESLDEDVIGKRWNGTSFEEVQDEIENLPPGWPEISKFEFRKLLKPEHLLIWDNWKEMNLGLTKQQEWSLNTFIKSFELAEKITVTEPMTIQGLQFCVDIGLLTEEDVERILIGKYPE